MLAIVLNFVFISMLPNVCTNVQIKGLANGGLNGCMVGTLPVLQEIIFCYLTFGAELISSPKVGTVFV
jgi:hypothetical protein